LRNPYTRNIIYQPDKFSIVRHFIFRVSYLSRG
jgi:hypothetical protein